MLGAGALAVLVSLLAAGGIGVPAVAAGLWLLVAVGLNLAEGRIAPGPAPEFDGVAAPFGLALVWVAILGTFFGQTLPFWRAESLMESADRVIAQAQRLPWGGTSCSTGPSTCSSWRRWPTGSPGGPGRSSPACSSRCGAAGGPGPATCAGARSRSP